jgi:glutamate racemase
VLGCTHYPLLARTISEVMGPSPNGDRVVLVSSGEETAFEVAALLDAIGGRRLPVPGDEPARHRFLTSGDPATFRTLGARFLGPEVESVEAWQWN